MTGRYYVNIALILCCLPVFLAMPAASDEGEIQDLPTYMDLFKEIDPDKFFEDENVIPVVLKCYLKETPCSKEYESYRVIIPSLVKTQCKGCTEDQKTHIRRTMNIIKTRMPEVWEKIVKLYDPKNTVLNKFSEAKI